MTVTATKRAAGRDVYVKKGFYRARRGGVVTIEK